MSDPDPEDEIHNRPSPHHAVGVAPYPYSGTDEINESTTDPNGRHDDTRNEQLPPEGRLLIFDHPTNPLGDPVVGPLVEHERLAGHHRKFYFPASRRITRSLCSGVCHIVDSDFEFSRY